MKIRELIEKLEEYEDNLKVEIYINDFYDINNVKLDSMGIDPPVVILEG